MSEQQSEQTPQQISGSYIQWLYQKVLATCGHPSANWVLGILSFTESCCFIIPPEALMLPMTYAKRAAWWKYALITTITSVLGAIAGYYMGAYLWHELQPVLFEYIPGFAKYFDVVGDKYKDNAVLALFLAAFTPIPFKVFTVAAGVYSTKIGILTLIATSIVGRGLRYFIMAGIVYVFGDKAQELIEKHFKIVSIVVMLLGVAVVTYLVLR